MNASVRSTWMMWPVRNPMARNSPISCTRSLTDAVMAKKMIMPATISKQRRDAEREFVEVMHGLHLELHGLLDRHCPGARQHRVHLAHHVLDGAAAAEGRQLDQAHRVPFVELLLDPGDIGEDQAVVLGPGVVQHAGHAKAPAADGDAVAGSELELRCSVLADQGLSALPRGSCPRRRATIF